MEPLSESASLDAQVLLAQVMERSRAWILAHPEAHLTLEQEKALVGAMESLKSGVPLPYILGRWEFYGLEFIVTPDTLIPRPETELIVENALAWLWAYPARRVAADVGTGSGCIAVTLASHIPDLEVTATELSWPALQVARQNAARHTVIERVAFVASDMLCPICRRFDLVCANLPYIPTTEMQVLETAKREPHLALDGGVDGLASIRRLLRAAPASLSPGGLLLLEIGAEQGGGAHALAREYLPHADVNILKDLAGRDRVLQVKLRG